MYRPLLLAFAAALTVAALAVWRAQPLGIADVTADDPIEAEVSRRASPTVNSLTPGPIAEPEDAAMSAPQPDLDALDPLPLDAAYEDARRGAPTLLREPSEPGGASVLTTPRPLLVQDATVADDTLAARVVNMPTQAMHIATGQETFGTLANRYYGDGTHWRLIQAANLGVLRGLDQPTAGMVLRIPRLSNL